MVVLCMNIHELAFVYDISIWAPSHTYLMAKSQTNFDIYFVPPMPLLYVYVKVFYEIISHNL